MPMYRRSMVVLLALVLLVAGGLFYGYSQRDAGIVLDSAQGGTPAEDIFVYVSGAVNRPGLRATGRSGSAW